MAAIDKRVEFYRNTLEVSRHVKQCLVHNIHQNLILGHMNYTINNNKR